MAREWKTLAKAWTARAGGGVKSLAHTGGGKHDLVMFFGWKSGKSKGCSSGRFGSGCRFLWQCLRASPSLCNSFPLVLLSIDVLKRGHTPGQPNCEFYERKNNRIAPEILQEVLVASVFFFFFFFGILCPFSSSSSLGAHWETLSREAAWVVVPPLIFVKAPDAEERKL